MIESGCSQSVAEKCTSDMMTFVQQGCNECSTGFKFKSDAMTYNEFVGEKNLESVGSAKGLAERIVEGIKNQMPVARVIQSHLLTEVVHKKIIIKDNSSSEEFQKESLPDMSDLFVVLVPLLAVLAGVGVGINFAMIQDEENEFAIFKDRKGDNLGFS